jgi:hypothetical protein
VTTAEHRSPESPWRVWFLLPLLLPLLAIVVVALAVWFAAAIVLLLSVWLFWCSRGRFALLVYSNSPVGQEYFEREILPMVADRCVVLNWSERKRWRFSLAVAVFWCFGGSREFNPLAIVFRPFTWPRWFRFYRPFTAFKHGRPEKVDGMRRELFRVLGRLRSTSTSGNP